MYLITHVWREKWPEARIYVSPRSVGYWSGTQVEQNREMVGNKV